MHRSFLILTSLCLLFTSYQAFSFQDIDKLLADPDITWVGEVYVDYHPNLNITDVENDEVKNRHETIDYNAIKILKVKRQVSDDQLDPIPNLLSQKIFQFNSNALNVYKDAALKEKLSYKAYQEIIHQKVSKTKMYSDPETFEQIIEVIESEINASNIELFRLKQLLSYNAKTNQLNITPIAIAPLQYINKFASSEEKALFWMPIKEAFQVIDLDNSSIDWAKRFNKDIPTNAIKTIKGTKDLSNIFMDMIVGYRANASTSKMYEIKEPNNQLVAIKADVIKEFGIEVSTRVSFHPETHEEIISVFDNSLTAKDLPKIRINQDWVWDNKTQNMQVRVLGFSPIVYRPDHNGNYFNTLCYYIKSKSIK